MPLGLDNLTRKRCKNHRHLWRPRRNSAPCCPYNLRFRWRHKSHLHPYQPSSFRHSRSPFQLEEVARPVRNDGCRIVVASILVQTSAWKTQ